MSRVQKSDTDQQQFWRMVLETFQSSGLSIRQFCKQEGLSEASFYAWRKKMANVQTPDVRKEQIHPEPFIQVSVPTAESGCLELLLASGHCLRIPSEIDSTFLSGVLSALKQARLC